MTNEEAIKLLSEAPIMGITRENSTLPLAEAIELTIKVLEQSKVTSVHWIKKPLKKYPDEYGLVCSICNRKALAEYNYCPNCGKKMRWHENDE